MFEANYNQERFNKPRPLFKYEPPKLKVLNLINKVYFRLNKEKRKEFLNELYKLINKYK